MIPRLQSNETWDDAETNVAVNPANPSLIVGSAKTENPTNPLGPAPIFVSTDRGNTWSLNSILPSAVGHVLEISVSFASSGILYSGIIMDDTVSNGDCVLLRTSDPTSGRMMTTLVDRDDADHPFITAATVAAGTVPHDRIFTGDNHYTNNTLFGSSGHTAEVMVSNAAEGALPVSFSDDVIEERSTESQDLPGVRTAIHPSGVVYGLFYRWVSGNTPNSRCDVIVCRDDNFATGAAPFTALKDGSDGLAGMRVDSNVLVPTFGGSSVGGNSLDGLSLAVAVDPNNPANVFVAWCDMVGTTDFTLHVRQSTNSGVSWSRSDLLTISNATNPGLAISSDGKVGVLYQQVTGGSSSQFWETHFRLSSIGGTSFTDDILSRFASADVGSQFGDFLRMQAVGTSFFGVFAASNRPSPGNFPHHVIYRRNANFSTGQLLDLTNTTPVGLSFDPFFFEISPQAGPSDICERFPWLCHLVTPPHIHLPPYICKECGWPCLTCPQYEIPIGDLYTPVFKDRAPETVLSIPYFHLFLDGFNTSEYDLQITTAEGAVLSLELNKTANGYAVSFRPSRDYYNRKEGLHGLKVGILPKTEAAAKKGLQMQYRLEASDYRGSR
jgi:hypothetical protein